MTERQHLFKEAITAGINLDRIYEPYMESLMEDVCLRSTLLILKDSWQKHLNEFGRLNDTQEVIHILENFPVIQQPVNNDDEMCLGGLHLQSRTDVRSIALQVFEQIWQTALEFFNSPPSVFYGRSDQFFKTKLHYLETYLNPGVREMVQQYNMPGFGREEKRWIDVKTWRELYIIKMREYMDQPEAWKLSNAVNHSYFVTGMQKAMTEPQAKVLSQEMLLSDEALDLGAIEQERRRYAKERLWDISERWGFKIIDFTILR